MCHYYGWFVVDRPSLVIPRGANTYQLPLRRKPVGIPDCTRYQRGARGVGYALDGHKRRDNAEEDEEEPGFWRHGLGVGDVMDALHVSVPHAAGVSSTDDDFDLYSKKKRKKRGAYDRDEFKESSRRLFRTVFDHDTWAEHRATGRYLRHIAGMFESRLMHGLSTPLMAVAVWATLVAIGHECVHYGVLVVPEGLKDVLFLNSTLPMSLTSSILGLLLVFRTNSSYSRWLDARKNWGLLTNRSRDIVRQGLTWLPDDPHMMGMLCRWVVAHAYCLKCHLRENEDAVEKLRQLEILHERELEALSRVRHKPMYAMQVLSMFVRKLSEKRHEGSWMGMIQSMDLNITQMEDICGSCERILRTPIPLSYTRHTSRFMIIWLSLLPFALWESCGWGMVPLSVAISLLTLGVEEIGVIIEEPFSVLPLERICATIASDVKEIRGHESYARNDDADIIPVSSFFDT